MTIIRKHQVLVAVIALSSAACAHTLTDKERAQARLRYDIGIASLGQGDVRGALRELLGAVELDPGLAVAHNALGLVFHTMGRRADALGHYRIAVELEPKFSEAHNNMGVLLLDMGRYAEAIAAFKVALSDILYNTPSLAEGNMGWAHYKNGEVDAGLKHLRNAVAMNPKFCRGYGWLAEVELSRAKAEQVVAYCKRFEKHCLNDETIGPTIPPQFAAEMKYHLGLGHLKLGDAAAAREAFTACTSQTADNAAEIRSRCARSLAGLE